MADQELLIVVRMRDEASAVLKKWIELQKDGARAVEKTTIKVTSLQQAMVGVSSGAKTAGQAIDGIDKSLGSLTKSLTGSTNGFNAFKAAATALNGVNSGIAAITGRSGMAGAAQVAGAAAGGIGRLAASAGGLLRVLGPVGAAVGQVIGPMVELVDKAAALQDAHEKEIRYLTTVTGQRGQATAFYKEIADFASDTGIAINDATEKAVMFAKASEGLGATARQTLGVTKSVEQLSQISGAPDKVVATAQEALAKALSESKVSAADLKTILGTVPQIADQIARGMGVSVLQLRLMATEGKLTNQAVFDALQARSNDINAEFARMPRSVGSAFQSMADDLSQVVQRLANGIPLVREYRLAIDAAAAGAKQLNKATTPETPSEVIARTNATAATFKSTGPFNLNQGGVLTMPSPDLVIKNDEMAQRANAQRALHAQRILDDQAYDKAIVAATNNNLNEATGIAAKLNPVAAKLEEIDRQSKIVKQALADVVAGKFPELSATQTAARIEQLRDTLDRLAKEAEKAGTAADKAMRRIDEARDQAMRGLTSAQIDLEKRTKSYAKEGEDPGRAEAISNYEQVELARKSVDGLRAQAQAEEAKTKAMREGKQATLEYSIAAAVAAWKNQYLATTTVDAAISMEELEKKATAFIRSVYTNKELQKGFGGGGVNASKALLDELDNIHAAMKKVEEGAYAMRRAEAEAKAARATDGTGKLQMEAFEAKQALTDKTIITNLKIETEYLQKMAAAAGDVVKQRKLQIDLEISRATRDAAPASRPGIEDAMRGKAAADENKGNADWEASNRKRSEDFVTRQAMEREAVGRSSEAAASLRLQFDMVNQAKERGMAITPALMADFKQMSDQMAEAEGNTQRYKEVIGFAKETMKGFFTDVRANLKEGMTVWEAFGKAGVNALNKITDKLFDMVTNKVVDKLFEGLLNAGSAGTGSGGGWIASGLSWITSLFADGGIMTSRGPMPLRKYSGGGIATSPQLALFGEGSVPEAYVPVPSGRIPVELRGGGLRGGMTVQTNVNVNMTAPADGQGSGGSGGRGNMMEQARELGAIVTAMVNKNLQDQMRPGGLLNPSGSFSAGVVQ